MVDRFPEAFRRFESQVNVDRFSSYRQLLLSFSYWAGERWQDTYKQNRALMEEGKRLGFTDVFMPMYHIRAETNRQRKRRRTVSTARRKWKRRAVRIPKVKKSVRWYVNHKYSANRIQRRLKKRGIGIRRKTLLKYVREAKKKSVKANSEKYTPRKYRRHKR
jgi:hypothetical protein